MTVKRIIRWLFSCTRLGWIHNTSFPRTNQPGTKSNGLATYVVCLDCGEVFPYDWNAMKIIKITRQQP